MFDNLMYPADDNYLSLFAFNRRAYRGKKKKKRAYENGHMINGAIR